MIDPHHPPPQHFDLFAPHVRGGPLHFEGTVSDRRFEGRIENGTESARFEAVLRGQIKEGRRRDPVAEEFRDILLAGLDGAPAARDLPDLLISVALDTFLATEEYLRAEPYGRSSIDVDLYFGIKEHLRHDFFPASAFRGPWINLLTHHPRKGLDFLIQELNREVNTVASKADDLELSQTTIAAKGVLERTIGHVRAVEAVAHLSQE